ERLPEQFPDHVPHHPRHHLVALGPAARDGLRHRRRGVGRHALLCHELPGRASGDRQGALRSGRDRRRLHRAAIPLHHGAATTDDLHHHRDAVHDLDGDQSAVRPGADPGRTVEPDRDLPAPGVRDCARRAPSRHGRRRLADLLPGARRADHLAHAAHAARAGRVGMRSVTQTRRLLKWGGNLLLALLLVWTLVPFYWMFATSIKKDKEIYGFEATLIPRRPTLDSYRRLFVQTPFIKYMRN